MLHRIFAILIVGFWLAMTGLLIIREVFPEATRLNHLPVSYVGGLFFQHGQSSDLQIYDAGNEVGYLHLQPRISVDKKTRVLEYHGMMTVNPLGMTKQRLSWTGSLRMNERNEMRRMEVVLSTQEPSTQLRIIVDSEANNAEFSVRADGNLVDQSTITLDREGLAKLLSRAGLETAAFQQLLAVSPTAATPAPELSAYSSSTRLNGETVSTYLVTMKLSGQTLFEAHVSQLGQVLRAHTPLFGFKLAPQNIAP
jgi:hypothetical protein